MKSKYKVPLQEYLERKNLSVYRLAKECNVDYFKIYRVAKGGTCTMLTAYKIYLATNGEIELYDLLTKKEIEKAQKDIQRNKKNTMPRRANL